MKPWKATIKKQSMASFALSTTKGKRDENIGLGSRKDGKFLLGPVEF